MHPIAVIQDTKYPTMYRLKWKDGVLSADFYNLSRANDILQHYDAYVAAMAIRGLDPRRHTHFAPAKAPPVRLQ